MSNIYGYCIRIRGMYKEGRALRDSGASSCPMSFKTREAAVQYINDNGLANVCYASPIVYEEDYYIKTWPIDKIKLIKVKE